MVSLDLPRRSKLKIGLSVPSLYQRTNSVLSSCGDVGVMSQGSSARPSTTADALAFTVSPDTRWVVHQLRKRSVVATKHMAPLGPPLGAEFTIPGEGDRLIIMFTGSCDLSRTISISRTSAGSPKNNKKEEEEGGKKCQRRPRRLRTRSSTTIVVVSFSLFLPRQSTPTSECGVGDEQKSGPFARSKDS